jgi:hypothetical protein
VKSGKGYMSLLNDKLILQLSDQLVDKIITRFGLENGYFVWDEVPGWLRAHGYNIKMLTDDELFFIEFEQEAECSKFLLEWA